MCVRRGCIFQVQVFFFVCACKNFCQFNHSKNFSAITPAVKSTHTHMEVNIIVAFLFDWESGSSSCMESGPSSGLDFLDIRQPPPWAALM